MGEPQGTLDRDIKKLATLKRSVEILGYELEIVKKSAKDVSDAWDDLPPAFRRALGRFVVTVELIPPVTGEDLYD